MSSILMQPYTDKRRGLKIKPANRVLLVSIEKQTLTVHEDGQPTAHYSVSTSLKPPSCKENSFGTPTGLHRIAQKIGENAPLGTVFKGRVEIGKTYRELSDEEQEANLITTRILWLEGLERGHNHGPGRDSHDRYIYFHGTNHEDKIGQPSSGGCIQLANEEIIHLFDLVDEGDHVYIQ
ncbi:MAG: L,D-transpeptidase [Verrucomicrobiota bacterium]